MISTEIPKTMGEINLRLLKEDLDALLALPDSTAELDAVMKDAERYRWLRENDGDDQVIVNWNIGSDWVSSENLDAAIDAAMKEQP